MQMQERFPVQRSGVLRSAVSAEEVPHRYIHITPSEFISKEKRNTVTHEQKAPVQFNKTCPCVTEDVDLLLTGPVVTEEKIQEAKLFYQMHFKQAVFDEEGWRKVLEVCSQV